jgi:glyoxylase-like metal-dependent hydrolase (beta-lactamase superfamily II)
MKCSKYIFFSTILMFGALSVHAQTQDTIPFRIDRLSDRVLILTEDSPMENIIVALASQKGLVVVDLSGSPVTAAIIRKVIEKEFDRTDFAYVINTHHHWDHAWGNQIFSDVEIVAHENCIERIRRDATTMERTVGFYARNMNTIREQLNGLDSDSDEAQQLQQRMQFYTRIHEGITNDFETTPPTITFNDRLTLDLGDMTLRLFYFGRAHSGSDIFIQVPEEEILITGDLFLDIGWLPLFAGQPILDIPRWIEVLSLVLDGDNKVTKVIPGHRKIWSRDKFNMWRDYIVNLWAGVNTAKVEGLTLKEVLDRFPLEEKYNYLKNLGHNDVNLTEFQRRNVEAFWKQLFESATTAVEKTVREMGLEAGIQKYKALKTMSSDKYFFDENEFNALGYRFLQSGQIEEAIEIFKINVEAYPDSWNVYNSLAEAYMICGNTELAIKNFKKSFELNPDNENGRNIVKRLEKEK